ncbi:MAG: phosphate signaling complex protein PhoU [Deltaproteobacteria bacterium]|nr:phosphate signaling complex protein PhoU [Deltaproteobacteria bacterium]
MTRVAYHNALKELENDVVEMANMVGSAVKLSIDALKNRNISVSQKIIKDDRIINKKRFDIEEKCLLLIATQQPMATDLRELAAILSIITDLERIGDHAEGNAKINLLLGDKPIVKPLVDIPKMADIGLAMLDDSIKTFMSRDAETAKKIGQRDDEVDAIYDKTYRELLMLMIENPKIVEGATYLIWVLHNLERIADRVTNIAERVVFMVTGKMEEMNVSKY